MLRRRSTLGLPSRYGALASAEVSDKAAAARERFETAARDLGLEMRVRQFPQGTHTASEAAAAVGCELGQIVKSLVFLCDGDAVMALTSGANRVDPRKLGAVLGGIVTRADADTVRSATGYSIGATPPFGHPRPLRTAIDESLLRYEKVWAAAGTADTVFDLSSDDLVRCTAGVIADFAVD